jgi:hypothetical protein
MSLNKPIRRVAIIGTGVIGASWIGANELSPHFCSERPQIRT